jgi:hypothetical protein
VTTLNTQAACAARTPEAEIKADEVIETEEAVEAEDAVAEAVEAEDAAEAEDAIELTCAACDILTVCSRHRVK